MSKLKNTDIVVYTTTLSFRNRHGPTILKKTNQALLTCIQRTSAQVHIFIIPGQQLTLHYEDLVTNIHLAQRHITAVEEIVLVTPLVRFEPNLPGLMRRELQLREDVQHLPNVQVVDLATQLSQTPNQYQNLYLHTLEGVRTIFHNYGLPVDVGNQALTWCGRERKERKADRKKKPQEVTPESTLAITQALEDLALLQEKENQ